MIPETTQTPDGWRFIWTDTAPPVQVELTRHPERGATEADATVWIADGEVWGQVTAPTRLDILQPGSRSQLVRHLQGRRVRGVLWADLIEQACTLALTQMRAVRTSAPQTSRALDLMHKQLVPPRTIVEGIVTEGLWILGGRPKTGKSWLVLGLALAIGYGGKALGAVEVEAGPVLYLALEDSEIRLQKRIGDILQGTEPPADFHYTTEWAPLEAGGVEDLDLWLNEHPGTRLVIIDTLAKAQGKPDARSSGRLYAEDYHLLASLQSLAGRQRVAIIVCHHLRKSAAEDPMEQISGTSGITGAVDGAMVLNRRRHSKNATLHVMGRDLPGDRELALVWDDGLVQWNLVGDAEGVQMSTERKAIREALIEAGEPVGPKELAEVTNMQPGAVRRLLWGMVKSGQVNRAGFGKYAITADGASAPDERDQGDQLGDHFSGPTGSLQETKKQRDHSDQAITRIQNDRESDRPDRLYLPPDDPPAPSDRLIAMIAQKKPNVQGEPICVDCGEPTGSILRVTHCLPCAMKDNGP